MKKILFFIVTFLFVYTIYAQNGIDYSIDSPITAKISNGDVATGVHIVQSKESLYYISNKYNLTVDELCEINNIHKNVPLHVSQSLKIVAFYQKDGGNTSLNTDQPSVLKEVKQNIVRKISEPVENAMEKGTYHVIQFKETLYSISKQYGTTVTKLKRLNNLDSNLISLGQKLRVK